MEVNGYQIKDVEEKLKIKLSRYKAKIEKANKYYESDVNHNERNDVLTLISEYDGTLTTLALVSDLHCYYNTHVHDSQFSLQTAIKMQGVYQALVNMWSSMASTQRSYDSGYRTKDEKVEYPKYHMNEEECQENNDQYQKSLTGLKGKIRTLNATNLEVPAYMLNWAEPLFS